jgi:hypothetical protein
MSNAAPAYVALTPPAGTRTAGTGTRRRPRALHATLVAVIALPVTLAWATGAQQDGPLAYVLLMLLLCTMPLLLPQATSARLTLLYFFLAYYFYSFAFGDLTALLVQAPQPPREAMVTAPEWAILAGAACAIAGYVAAQALLPMRAAGLLRDDWQPQAIATMGWLCWFAGTYATVVVLFGVGEGLFGNWLGLVVLARMLGLIGVMLLAYLGCTRGGGAAWASLALVLLADFVLGFLSDSKEAAFRGQFLAVLTWILVKRRVPWLALAASVLLAGLTFPTFAAYRHHLATGNLSRVEALGRLQQDFRELAAPDTTLGERLQSGLEYLGSRSNLKGVIDTVVTRTGVDVPFQDGATFAALAYVFIPRALLPDKPNTLTGQLFNLEFGISESTVVYISNTMLGEFYWNFGWTGLLAGMLATGMFMGTVNRAVDFDVRANLPRLIVLMLTIYVVVLRFEANVAQAYTLWLRTMLLFALLHALMPRRRPGGTP